MPIFVTTRICSDGTYLPSLAISKGRNTGNEFTQYRNLYTSKNKTAWMTSDKFLSYLQIEVPLLRSKHGSKPRKLIFVYDTFPGHKSDKITQYLKINNCAFEYVPPGCTSLLQPSDKNINFLPKQYLINKYEQMSIKIKTK
jgi:hypothetical protein